MNTLATMAQYGHERLCLHTDEETGLRAIIAIHSTTLGDALGGTRRWHYATEADALEDVLRLSEGMTLKAACAGLAMGGAKSVILLPSPGAPATKEEARAMGRFIDTFSGNYIAAEDVGVDEQFVDWMAEETPHVMGGVTRSRGGDPSPRTARGVFQGMKACLAQRGLPIDFAGLHVAIQGVGSVGRSLTELLVNHGATVTVADICDEYVVHVRDAHDVKHCHADDLLEIECDILAPCAMGAIIGAHNIAQLKCSMICGAANNQLVNPVPDSRALVDRGILYAPDFVVNAGGLIILAGLHLGMTEDELNTRIDAIEQTTLEILGDGEAAGSTHLAAERLARQRIAAGRNKEQAHAS
jgi:leucine dehydrogenase